MTEGFHAIRVLRKRENGVMYAAIHDLLKCFEQEKLVCKTPQEEEVWIKLIDKFTHIIFEGLNNDL